MTKTQIGWLLLFVSVGMITVLLIGDVIALWHSHGQIDSAFVMGMITHYGAVVTAFAGGGYLRQFGGRAETVSDQKRAEL